MNQVATKTSPPFRKLFTVKQFAERNQCFSESALRYQIFNSKSNGLEASGALVRIGKKLLIDEDKYFGVWVDSQQEPRHD